MPIVVWATGGRDVPSAASLCRKSPFTDMQKAQVAKGITQAEFRRGASARNVAMYKKGQWVIRRGHWKKKVGKASVSCDYDSLKGTLEPYDWLAPGKTTGRHWVKRDQVPRRAPPPPCTLSDARRVYLLVLANQRLALHDVSLEVWHQAHQVVWLE